jgi:hypothetical protein
VPPEIGGDVERLSHILRLHKPADPLEIGRQAQIPVDLAAGGTEAPLLMGAGQGCRLAHVPVQPRLQDHRLALAAATAKSVDHAAQPPGLGLNRQKPIGPAADPFRRGLADGGAVQLRRNGRQRIKPGIDRVDTTAMRHGLACQQGADDRDAFAEPGVAFGLLRPGQTGHVLVDAFAAAKGKPEALREHFGQGGSSLRDDGRMIAIARRGDQPERQAASRHGRADPAPGET